MAKVKFKSVATMTVFDGMTKLDNYLYYVVENGLLYKGSTLYGNDKLKLGDNDNFPATGRVGMVYYKPSTGEVRRWWGGAWDVLCRPIANALTSTSTNSSVAGAKAAYDAAQAAQTAAINSAKSYTDTEAAKKMPILATGNAGMITKTNGAGGVVGTNIAADDVVTLVKFDTKFVEKNPVTNIDWVSGDVRVYFANGTYANVGMPAFDVLKSASFNESTGILSFVFTDDTGKDKTVNINLHSLVDVYYGQQGQYLDLTAINVPDVSNIKTYAVGEYAKDLAAYPGKVFKCKVANKPDGSAALGNTTNWQPLAVVDAGSASNVTANASERAVLYIKEYYLLPANQSLPSIAAIVKQRPIQLTVEDYQIKATVVLGTHLAEAGAGIYVQTVGTITAGGTGIPTAGAVATAIADAKSAAIAAAATDAATKANAAQTAAAADATSKDELVLTSAKTYADQTAQTKANTALASAKTYTDAQIEANALEWETA